jgi:hypothetical protein
MRIAFLDLFPSGHSGGSSDATDSAAGKPLEIEFSEDAWRSRVRTILKAAPG